MPTRRRIVRSAVMAVVVVVLAGLLLAWAAMSEPPETQRSRGIRLGMSPAEVAAVMGDADGADRASVGNKPVLISHYGRSQRSLKRLHKNLGLSTSGMYWPVRVFYSHRPTGWCVVRIERGEEIEESP